jgi:BirA family biotin operon repressor/biotin-[acetyl-CoA-carboxylase] ligase
MALRKYGGENVLFNFRRFQENLRTAVLGRCLHWYPEVTSTMDLAWEAGTKHNAPPGTIIVAETQTNGRGRAGRKWASANSGALLFSLILKAPKTDWRDMVQVNLGIAVAIVQAVESLKLLSDEHKRIGVKWPNDVWVDGKKLCGILVDSDATILNIGVGVNVSNELADEVKDFATNLGVNAKREVLLAEIMNHFEVLLEKDLDEVLVEYARYDLLYGKEVIVMPKRLEDTSSHYVAECVGLSKDGFLLVRKSGEDKETMLSAEEVSVRPFLDSMKLTENKQ